jgi:hypothetical protein
MRLKFRKKWNNFNKKNIKKNFCKLTLKVNFYSKSLFHLKDFLYMNIICDLLLLLGILFIILLRMLYCYIYIYIYIYIYGCSLLYI